MRQVNKKIHFFAMFFFLFTMSSFLIASFYLWNEIEQTPEMNLSNTSVYVLNEEERLRFYKNEEIRLNSHNIQSISNIYQQLYPSIQFKLVFYIIGYGLSIVIVTCFLCFFLKRMYTANMKQIVKQLSEIDSLDDVNEDDPELGNAFFAIQSRLTSNMEDFKRLYSYLSHEQKNTLGILQHQLELHHNQEDLECFGKVSDSIDDILTLSETDNQEMVEINVALVCAKVCDVYRNMYNSITFDYDEDGDTMVYGKERWVYRAISNIVDNAIKYGQDKPIEVSVRNKRNCVIVAIKDHGIGISEEDQSEIFDHLYRVKELKKDGYGIGLSLVSHVCDLCGGFASVESELGKGSTFYLSFPCS